MFLIRRPNSVQLVTPHARGRQVAYDAKALAVYSRLNGACDLIVQDASSLAAQGERLSFADLQLRAQAVGQVRAGEALTRLASLYVGLWF